MRPEVVARPARFSIDLRAGLAQQLDRLLDVAAGLAQGLLQSIMGRPVCSRSALTAAAVISAMGYISNE